MREIDFALWLENSYRTDKGVHMDPSARGSRISNCRRIEQHLGDLDRAYDTDKMESILEQLSLGKYETARRHSIPIAGDTYIGTATLKAAARLYQKFRNDTASLSSARPQRSPSIELDTQLRTALPDDSRRMQAAEFMGRLIDLAGRTMPEGWVLSWRQKRGIFLSLTFFRIFAIDRNRIFIAFTTSDASPEFQRAVENARIRRRTFAGFRSLDDTIAAYVPASFYFEHRQTLEPLIEKFAGRIAQKYGTTAFSRFHSPVAVEWVEKQIGRELPSPTYELAGTDADRMNELSELVDEFETWCASDAGKEHLRSYAASRASAAKNLAEIRTARDAGDDITDRVLRSVLPHFDTAKNRERGAWITIASALAGDVRTKFQRTDEQWQRIAERILEFIEATLTDPANLIAACERFSRSPESRSFQSGMLTPFLNAIDPEHFAILNKKSRVATTYIAGTRFGQNLTDYPEANDIIRATAAQVGDLIDAPDLADMPDVDLYDAFSHWLVSERRFFDEPDEDEPLFTQRALDLFALLDADPSAAVYQKHKSEFRAHIEEPFRRLFTAVAEKLTPEMLSVLETEKNLFSRFLKNDYGKGGAWPYYWGAFYPKDTKRVRGIQLFVYASSRYLTFGFFAGDPADDSALRVSRYLRDAEQIAGDGFDRVLSGYQFGDGRRIDDGSLFPTLQACIASGDDADLLDIRKILRPDAMTSLSFAELVDIIATSFRELFPLMRIGIGAAKTAGELSPIAEYDIATETAAPADAPEYPLDELAHDTGIARDTAAMWVRAIQRKKQAIFYGPPGTGKTFLADKLARHLIGRGDGFMETLQFHPAYSYEDFMEGMRPQSNGDGLSYPIVPGRFRSFCERAARRSGTCVLIIDEINRANLARVLGELMYLLEYRDRSVPLASGTEFRIPENVLIIGTMNTADRSIALVDHALRRRFAFLPLHPDYRVLTAFHEQSPLSKALASVLEDINKPIDAHYRIGISFFLVRDLEQHLVDIWRMEIEPYLEEYFFDDAERCKEMRWERVATRLPITAAEELEEPPPQPSTETLAEPRE